MNFGSFGNFDVFGGSRNNQAHRMPDTQGRYGPPQGQYPPGQYPPQQGQYPPQQGHYPPQQGKIVVKHYFLSKPVPASSSKAKKQTGWRTEIDH